MNAFRTLCIVAAVTVSGLIGLASGGIGGAGLGVTIGLVLLGAKFHGLTLLAWGGLFVRRHHVYDLAEPVTVANDRAGGGVRYQDGFAVVVVQVLGKLSSPTLFTGAVTAHTSNVFDLRSLYALMRQPLGLTISSISVVTTGARRIPIGDYSRVYDTLIGTPPYAGRRETWLVIRVDALASWAALEQRISLGAATIAVAQRIEAALRRDGIRARVGTACDITALERRLGVSAICADGARARFQDSRWRSIRTDSGWLTTYAYQRCDITPDVLGQAWSLRVDDLTQNITLFPDETVSAIITVRTAQRPDSAPSVALRTMPGEQASAILSHLCGPMPALLTVDRGPLPPTLSLPIGASGVLLGKLASQDRLMLPLTDPSDFTRVNIVADDAVAKRLIIRMAATGERITLHTSAVGRWDSINMPNITITRSARPARGTTVSVVDGSVVPAPRPNAIVMVADSEGALQSTSDIRIKQTGEAAITVDTKADTFDVVLELFRAENRYLRTGMERADNMDLIGNDWV